MSLASFKDLCVDAADARALGRFWGQVLGSTVVDLGDGSVRLDAPDGMPARGIWVDPVPEPRTVKTRVHLDLRLPSPDPAPLLRSGARVEREPVEGERWWVLADPDGSLFCAFPPREGDPGPPVLTPIELVVDSSDPAAQAAWWAGVLGGSVVAGDDPWASVEGAGGFPYGPIVFNPVAEAKTVKNRWHWDVELAGPDPSELVGEGARVLRERGGDISWWVMADPEGNEFCAFAAGRS